MRFYHDKQGSKPALVTAPPVQSKAHRAYHPETMRWLKLWFRLDGQVEQRVYLGSGLFLMALKYGVDQLLSKLNGGEFIDPSPTCTPTCRFGWRPWGSRRAPGL